MGSNDFCQACYERDPLDLLKTHKENLVGVLRMLRDNLPRTLVNLVNPPCMFLVPMRGRENVELILFFF